MSEKRCASCDTVKSFDDFGLNRTKKDGFASTCKECRRRYAADWYAKNPNTQKARAKSSKKKCCDRWYDFLMDYLACHPCVDCGETDPIVLEFDHVRGEKSFNISDKARSCSLEVMKLEILKCDVRCANCHKRKTAYDFGHGKALRTPR